MTDLGPLLGLWDPSHRGQVPGQRSKVQSLLWAATWRRSDEADLSGPQALSLCPGRLSCHCLRGRCSALAWSSLDGVYLQYIKLHFLGPGCFRVTRDRSVPARLPLAFSPRSRGPPPAGSRPAWPALPQDTCPLPATPLCSGLFPHFPPFLPVFGTPVPMDSSAYILHSHLRPQHPRWPLCLGTLSAVWFCSLGTQWPCHHPWCKCSHPTEVICPRKSTPKPPGGAWHVVGAPCELQGNLFFTSSFFCEFAAPWSRARPLLSAHAPLFVFPTPSLAAALPLPGCALCLPHWAELPEHRDCLFIFNSIITKATIVQYLPRARHNPKCFPNINSFNPHRGLVRYTW